MFWFSCYKSSYLLDSEDVKFLKRFKSYNDFNNHTNIVFGAKYINYCFVKDKVTIKDILNKFYKGKYY